MIRFAARSFLILLSLGALARAASNSLSYVIYKTDSPTNAWVRADNGLSKTSRINSFLQFERSILVGTEAGLFVSADDGGNWTPIKGAPTNLVRVSSLTSLKKSIFAGTTADGIFRSTDSGKTWKPWSRGLGAGKVRSLLSWDKATYAGTDAGEILRLKDGGKEWTRFSEGLPPGTQVFSLAGVSNRLFAALYSRGLYMREVRGKAWQKIGGDLTPIAIAVSSNTLISGRNPGGLDWSSDGGMTWERANPGASPLLQTTENRGDYLSSAPVWTIAANPKFALAAAHDGIFYSFDGGRTWSKGTTGLAHSTPAVAFLAGDRVILAAVLTKEPAP